MPAKILVFDIETSPNLGYVFSLWQQNLGLNQVTEFTEVMCFAAKWLDKKKIEFFSTHHHGKEVMVNAAHSLLDEADAVIGYNSVSFDAKHLNREFLMMGLNPPAPYKHIDLIQTVRNNFRFPSNKLDHITSELGLSGKLQHNGFEMWRDAMAGDTKAWALFKKYNVQDVRTTEELYYRLQPWLDGKFNHGLHTESDLPICPKCGSDKLQRRGTATTGLGRYKRYQCQTCGGWSRGKKGLEFMDVRAVS